MLTSCRAIPEAASEEDQEIVTSDWEMLPLGDGVPTDGGVRSTRIDADFIVSMRPAASIDCHWSTWSPSPTTKDPAYVVQEPWSRVQRVINQEPAALASANVTSTAGSRPPLAPTAPSTNPDVLRAPRGDGICPQQAA